MSIYDADGKIKTTAVDGSTWTGLYAASGESINIVLDDVSKTGVYHACGALRVNSSDGDTVYDPSGAFYINHLLGSQRGGVLDELSFDELTLSKAPTAYFGVRRLAGYVGPCLQTGGTTDVDFVNNQLQATTGNVSRLYEQAGLGGGGLFAVQGTDANRPHITSLSKIGTVQGIMFDGANSGTTRNRELVLPIELALPSKDHTAVFVARSAVGNALSAFGGAADSDAVSNDVIIWTVGQGLALRGTAITNQTMPTYVPSNPGVFALTGNAANTICNQLNRFQNRTTPTTAETTAGGRLGNCTTANNRGTFVLLAALFFTPALTAGEYTTLRGELETAFGLTTTYDTTFAYIGDSNFEGTFTSNCQNAVTQISDALRAPARHINGAAFGTTYASWDALYPGVLTGQFSGWTATNKFVVSNLGINSLIDGVAAATMISTLQTFITEATSNGWGYVAYTIPPCGSLTAGEEIERVAYNTDLRANWETYGAAALVDLDNDVRLQDFADTSIYADGLHYTNAGAAIVAELSAAQIDALTWS